MDIITKLTLKKYKLQIITAGVVIIVLVGFIWTARPTPGNGPGVAVANGASISGLTVSERSFEFGTISMAAGKVSRRVTVKNTSAVPMTIGKLYTSCMCTEVSLIRGETRMGPFGMPMHGPIPRIDQTLASGEEATVEIVFDPAAHGPAGVGYIKRVVTLEDPSGSKSEFNFSAMVTP